MTTLQQLGLKMDRQARKATNWLTEGIKQPMAQFKWRS